MKTSNVEVLAVPVNEACRVLNLGRTTIYSLISAKELPVIKIGKRSLIPTEALRNFVAAKMSEAA